MNPATAIAPVPTIRRRNAKRVHLFDYHGDTGHGGAASFTYCGQSISFAVHSDAYNAEQITCNACLVDAISRKGIRS